MRRIWQVFNIIAGIASIASVVLALFNKAAYATLGFHIFLISLFLAYVSFKIYDFRIVKRFPYENILAYYRWILFDDHKSQFDVFKIIKSNRPYLPTITLKQAWSGRGDIEVTANDSLIRKNINNSNISIGYPVALYLNEFKSLHYTLLLDDKENKQCPYLNCGGKNKIGMLILEIFIPNSNEMPDAKVYVTNVGGSFHSGELVNTVKFNPITHSYHWELLNFPGDCVYWLVWGEDKKLIG